MANIFDYLEWRGDVPFSTDPFNEVDNLVLAELAYTDFDGVVAPQGEPVSVRTVRDRYFSPAHARGGAGQEDLYRPRSAAAGPACGFRPVSGHADGLVPQPRLREGERADGGRHAVAGRRHGLRG